VASATLSADEGYLPPAGRTAEVHRILPAACRIRIEAFVEEVKGDPRRTGSRGMTEYLIATSPPRLHYAVRPPTA
jgi:hypothetical protein